MDQAPLDSGVASCEVGAGDDAGVDEEGPVTTAEDVDDCG